MVVNGDFHEFEPEKLRGLMKILPEPDEVVFRESLNNILKYSFFQIEMLKSWEGDTKKLGNAERFILQLINVKK